MSFNAHDNIVLVAPRPVRLAAPSSFAPFHPAIVRPQPRAAVRLVSAPPTDALDRLKISDESGDEEFRGDHIPSERDSASPRASPRANLNTEALEEFLSILRPTTSFLFPPTSPILRASRANVATTYFPYRRTPSSVSPSIPSDGLGLTLTDDIDKENDSYPYRFFSKGPLASPVARQLTRNPFQRHASYDSGVTTYITAGPASPSPIGPALSPATVPLPSPGPDETDI